MDYANAKVLLDILYHGEETNLSSYDLVKIDVFSRWQTMCEHLQEAYQYLCDGRLLLLDVKYQPCFPLTKRQTETMHSGLLAASRGDFKSAMSDLWDCIMDYEQYFAPLCRYSYHEPEKHVFTLSELSMLQVFVATLQILYADFLEK